MNDVYDPDGSRCLGERLFHARNLNAACYYYRRALRGYRKLKDTLAEGFCMRRIGQIVLAKSYTVRNYGPQLQQKRTAHNHHKLVCHANDFFEAAAVRYQRLGDEVGYSDCRVGSATVELERSHCEEAKRSYEQCLEVFSRRYYEDKQADCLVGLAEVARRLNCDEEAMWLYKQANALYVRTKKLMGQGNCHLCLGDLALLQQKYGEANSHYVEAFRCYSSANWRLGRMHGLHALGDIALKYEFYGTAATNYSNALEIAKGARLQYTVGLMFFKIGCCFEKSKPRRDYFNLAQNTWNAIAREDLVRQWLDD